MKKHFVILGPMNVSQPKRHSEDWNISRQTVIDSLRREMNVVNQRFKFMTRNAKLEQILDIFFYDVQNYDAIAIYDRIVLASTFESFKHMDVLVDQYLNQTELVMGKLQLYKMLKNASIPFQRAVMVIIENRI